MVNNYAYGTVGSFNGAAGGGEGAKKYVIAQSLWSKPYLENPDHLKKLMHIAALSLCYAHKSGYRVHMHTDSYGYELLKHFGYDKLEKTLDQIPDSVPTEMFAAGKYYAMKAEGLYCVHVDLDVFLKKPVLDTFYKNLDFAAICQCEEDWDVVGADYHDKARHMHVLGYPAGVRTGWKGCMNVGVVGFNNPLLMASYMKTYGDALKLYTQEMFDTYKALEPNATLWFDFILEQQCLSYKSAGYNVLTLLPMENTSWVADKIGYQHLQGNEKWSNTTMSKVRTTLTKLDRGLFALASQSASRVKN